MSFSKSQIGELELAVTADTVTHRQMIDFMRQSREARRELDCARGEPLSDFEMQAIVVAAAGAAGWIKAPQRVSIDDVLNSHPTVISAWCTAINDVYVGAQVVDPKG